MTQYVRVTNSFTDRGRLIPFEEVEKAIDFTKEQYVSTYYYNQEQFDKFKTTGTVAGVSDVFTDKVWFDFDSVNPDVSKQSAVKTIERLNKDGIPTEDIEIYFSGNKGYHLVVNVNRKLKPKEVQAICNKYAGDLPAFDPSLYDYVQVLRAAGSKHQVSGLHKIPLTFKQVSGLSTEEIKTIAISVDNVNNEFEWKTVKPKDEFYIVPVIKEKPKVEFKEIDWSQRPNYWKPYKWALLQGYFDGGERHNALLVIAATCRALGYDKDTAYYMCKSAMKKQALRLNAKEFPKEELYNDIVKSVYSENWKGGAYSPKNNLWLQKYCEKMGFNEDEKEDEVIDIAGVHGSFKDFVVNIDKNTIKTGIKSLDDAMPITTGMNLGIVGAASAGKTAIALEILKNTSEAGVVSVIASLDMHRNRLFEKLLYKVSASLYGKPLSRPALYKMFQDNKENELMVELKKQYSNVYFYDRSCPTVGDLRKFIKQVEESTGKKVKLCMVDYFERLGSDISDATASSLKIAGELQDLINDFNIALITLVQPNKFSLSGGAESPILSYTAIKGSSFLYQSFRAIVSLWRPFFTPMTKEMDRFMEMAILKNDLGELGHFVFNWEGSTGSITEMQEEQYDVYRQYLKEKKEADAAEKQGSSGGWN